MGRSTARKCTWVETCGALEGTFHATRRAKHEQQTQNEGSGTWLLLDAPSCGFEAAKNTHATLTRGSRVVLFDVCPFLVRLLAKRYRRVAPKILRMGGLSWVAGGGWWAVDGER